MEPQKALHRNSSLEKEQSWRNHATYYETKAIVTKNSLVLA